MAEEATSRVVTVSETVTFRLRWDEIDDADAVPVANQFAIQVTPQGEFFISVGQVLPPLVTGDPDNPGATVVELENSELRVRLLGKFGVTPQVMFELYTLLQRQLQAMQEQQREAAEGQSE